MPEGIRVLTPRGEGMVVHTTVSPDGEYVGVSLDSGFSDLFNRDQVTEV